MNKLIFAGIVFGLLLVGLLALRFVLGGPEDSWLCESGRWIRHGNPSAPAPQGVCQP